MSRVPDFVFARLAALIGEELAALSPLTSFCRSRMRYLTGSSAYVNSGAVKRGVMCSDSRSAARPRQSLRPLRLSRHTGA
jgi:hypothetical protein